MRSARVAALAGLLLAAVPAGAEMTADDARRTMETYVRLLDASDVDAIMALYADDATVEDPVGSPLKRGRTEIEAFYRAVAANKPRAALLPPIAPSRDGTSAAMTFQVKVGGRTITVIEFMTFSPAGKIATMKAYSAPTP